MKTSFIILMVFIICSSVNAEVAIQTDWSGGPDVTGPVNSWGNEFSSEAAINWYSTSGDIKLAFRPPIEHPITTSYGRANHALPFDIDGDGDMDIISASGRYSPPYFFSGRIDWWENVDGDGQTWAQSVVDDDFQSAPVINAADIDGDGDRDIIAGAYGSINYIAWWENIEGAGIAWQKHNIPSTRRDCSSICAADFDGDGDMDILATDVSHNDIAWFENIDGSGGNWQEHILNGTAYFPTDVAVEDMNGDGYEDIIVAAFNGNEIFWWENTDGTGNEWQMHDIGNDFNGARSVFAADFDGDDDMDILGAASLANAVSWWENRDSQGLEWVNHPIADNFFYAVSVAAVDIDADGDTDALGAATQINSITWWENTNGDGTNWYEHTINDQYDGASEVSAGDMDNDGDPDIIGSAFEAGDIYWWDAVCCFESSGDLISSIFNTGASADWDSLSWIADVPSRTSLYFQVRGSADSSNMGAWSGNIELPDNLDAYISDGGRFFQYRVLFESADPSVTPMLESISVSWDEIVAIDNHSISVPEGFSLSQNYPNPFNVSTNINFQLPNPGKVTVTAYDIGGRQVEVIDDSYKEAGNHSINWNAGDLPSGIYFFRLIAGANSETRRMILIK